ncbi:hypothetical protein ACFLRM_06895, partial [Acidobacteriota bacterium]
MFKERRSKLRFEYHFPHFKAIPLKELKVDGSPVSLNKAVIQDFSPEGLRLLIYPPYSRDGFRVTQAFRESFKPGAIIDLIPSLQENNLEGSFSGKIQWVEGENEFYIAVGLLIEISESGVKSKMFKWLLSEWTK